MVHVGETWWSYTPSAGAHTNAGSPESALGVHLQRALLDPRQLLASRVFEIAGRTENAGTRIQISTDDLDADAIAKLAESLVAAPARP